MKSLMQECTENDVGMRSTRRVESGRWQSNWRSWMQHISKQRHSTTASLTVPACLRRTTYRRISRLSRESHEGNEIPTFRWPFNLTLLLTGWAQQAYAALNDEDTHSYAITPELQYHGKNISPAIQMSQTQASGDASRTRDSSWGLFGKWLRDDMTAAELCNPIITEQLLADVRIWVTEHKPKSSTEARQLTEDHIQARSAASSPPLLAPQTQPQRSSSHQGIVLGVVNLDTGQVTA